MTGNPAAPRTEAAGTAPVPYDRGIDPRHTTSRVPRRRAGGDVSASPFRTSLTAGNPMFPDLRETRGPGTGGPGHASNGTARRRAAAQWFFFLPVGQGLGSYRRRGTRQTRRARSQGPGASRLTEPAQGR